MVRVVIRRLWWAKPGRDLKKTHLGTRKICTNAATFSYMPHPLQQHFWNFLTACPEAQRYFKKWVVLFSTYEGNFEEYSLPSLLHFPTSSSEEKKQHTVLQRRVSIRTEVIRKPQIPFLHSVKDSAYFVHAENNAQGHAKIYIYINALIKTCHRHLRKGPQYKQAGSMGMWAGQKYHDDVMIFYSLSGTPQSCSADP